jgi:DNA primase
VMITSSYKDVIAFDVVGIDAVAPHTERGVIPEWCIHELSKYYQYIYIAYDNDETGVNSSIKLTGSYKDLHYWNVPKSLENCKDPSDILKNFDKNILLESLSEKFKRDKTECF